MTMKIGIMDSGLGGLTILKACLKALPDHIYLYYADSKNAPYGTKTKEAVCTLTERAVDFLITQGAEIIVIACNTATSAAADVLRQKYDIPIIGMEPALKPALKLAQNKRVIVAATALTLQQEKFCHLLESLDTQHQVDYLPLTELVNFAETDVFDEAVILPYLKEKFANFNLDQYGSVVLGCTHFPLFKGFFEKIFPENVVIVDGTVGTVNRLKGFVTEDHKKSAVMFYLSGVPVDQGPDFEKMQKILAMSHD